MKLWRKFARPVTYLGLLLGASGMFAHAQTILCPTPGKDGAPTSLSGIVNTYYPGTSSASVGATSLSVGSAVTGGATTPISAGDLLLVIQMQDAGLTTTNNSTYGASTVEAGKYEYVVATGSLSGGTVPIRGKGAGGGLINSYAASTYSSTSGQKTFQVVRVPQYSDVTLGGTIRALPWNGQAGGIVAFDVAGTLKMNSSTIDVSGVGFRGGAGRQLTGIGTATTATNLDYRSSASLSVHAQKGEGVAGTPRYVNNGGSAPLDTSVEGYPDGSSARGAPGNAGGGGTDGNPALNDQNSGGGGGGNGGAGGQGGRAWNSGLDVGGRGGKAFTTTASRLVLGGGGGAGTTNNGTGSPGSGFASSGAAGGGLVLIRADNISGSGTIAANGSNANSTVDNDGSGGGGAGGSVLLLARTSLSSGLTITAKGGQGGSNRKTTAALGERHGPGGGGGGGVIVLSHTGPTVNVKGGANGTTTTSNDSFGATSGADGQQLTVQSDQVLGFPAVKACSDLNVVKTNNASFVKSGGSTTYTIRVINNGPSPVTDVVLTDTPGSGLTLISAACTGATGNSCVSPPTGSSITLPPLAVGAFYEVSATGNVTSTDGTVSNAVTVTLPAWASDPQESNNTSVDTDPVWRIQANLVKTVKNITRSGTAGSDSTAVPGDVLEYCISFRNDGNVGLPNFNITDRLPSNVVAVVNAYGPGKGIQITRSGTTTYQTFANPVVVNLGTLGVAENGLVCFRAMIN